MEKASVRVACSQLKRKEKKRKESVSVVGCRSGGVNDRTATEKSSSQTTPPISTTPANETDEFEDAGQRSQ